MPRPVSRLPALQLQAQKLQQALGSAVQDRLKALPPAATHSAG